MCGIAGIASFGDNPVFLEEVQSMCDAMYHRGPDDCGYYESPATSRRGSPPDSPSVMMGMRRLSIIDLHTGRQPISNEEGSVWAVFNGEIYNFAELRRDLEAAATFLHRHRYRSHRPQLRAIGPGCVDRFAVCSHSPSGTNAGAN